jgi:carbamoyl-phosphate synthase large subunit
VAAKLAIGYTLDELKNEITGGATPASFEPTIDYVVTKVPRFTFEKFPQAADRLTTQMKSVGEVMAIGRTFQESLQKALRGLETGDDGLNPMLKAVDTEEDWAKLRHELKMPGSRRLWYVADAFRFGLSLQEVTELSSIDPWFLAQIKELVDVEKHRRGTGACSSAGSSASSSAGVRRPANRRLPGSKRKWSRHVTRRTCGRSQRVTAVRAEFIFHRVPLSTYEEFCVESLTATRSSSWAAARIDRQGHRG